MSRSPLHALLVRAARISRAADALGVPASELAPAIDESRRRFLAVASAGAGLAALEACARPLPIATPAPRHDANVLVVGAGIAGLTAAWRLRQAGVPVRVVDAQARVGGRMHSLRGHFADGQSAELGGELIDSGHASVQRLAAELGLALDDLHAGDAGVARDTWHFGGRARSEAEVVAAFAPVARLIAADTADLDAGAIGYDNPALAAALDRMSLAEWMERRGVSGWMRDLLAVAYTTEFGLDAERQSALNLLTMIDANGDPFRVFGDSDERYRVRGGNDLVTTEIAARLGDATFTRGARLIALGRRPGGGWRATLEQPGRATRVDATHVVLALPFTLLREVRLDPDLPPAKRRAIAELGYGTNAKLMVGFTERIWRTRHASSGSAFSDLPFQTAWETSRAQRGAAGILTNFTGGAHGVALGAGTAAEQASRFVADLDAVYPGAAAARAPEVGAVRFHWPAHEWTRGSYASYLAGQWTTLRGAEGERVGTLHFAGEHTSRDFQGFMEGGCESGERAAREVLGTLGLTLPPAGGRPAGRFAGRRAAVRAGVAALLRLGGAPAPG